MTGMRKLLTGARSASPYLLVEVLLPGGTLIALLMWLLRARSKRPSTDVQPEHPFRHLRVGR